jgi:hypothetical protein
MMNDMCGINDFIVGLESQGAAHVFIKNHRALPYANINHPFGAMFMPTITNPHSPNGAIYISNALRFMVMGNALQLNKK